MGYGRIARGLLNALDLTGPDAPSIVSIEQLSNSRLRVGTKLPTQDADGSPLTGLTKLSVAAAPFVDGIDPFEGISTMEEILALPGVIAEHVPLTEGDAGTERSVELPFAGFGLWSIAAACSDVQGD